MSGTSAFHARKGRPCPSVRPLTADGKQFPGRGPRQFQAAGGHWCRRGHRSGSVPLPSPAGTAPLAPRVDDGLAPARPHCDWLRRAPSRLGWLTQCASCWTLCALSSGGGSAMEFVQVIEFTTTSYDELRAVSDEFTEMRRAAGGPKPTSVLHLKDRDRPNTYRIVAGSRRPRKRWRTLAGTTPRRWPSAWPHCAPTRTSGTSTSSTKYTHRARRSLTGNPDVLSCRTSSVLLVALLAPDVVRRAVHRSGSTPLFLWTANTLDGDSWSTEGSEFGQAPQWRPAGAHRNGTSGCRHRAPVPRSLMRRRSVRPAPSVARATTNTVTPAEHPVLGARADQDLGGASTSSRATTTTNDPTEPNNAEPHESRTPQRSVSGRGGT